MQEERHVIALQTFLKMGPKRTLADVCRRCGECRTTVNRWAKREKWKERALEYDRENEAVDDDEEEARRLLKKARTGKKVRLAVQFLARLKLLGDPITPEEVKEDKKIEALRAYWMGCGNIAEACRMSGINRRTFDRWREEDLIFRQALGYVDEAAIGFVESKLMQLIAQGNIQAIIFYLKNRKPEQWNDDRFKRPVEFNQTINQQTAVSMEVQVTTQDEQWAIATARILDEVGGLYLPASDPGATGKGDDPAPVEGNSAQADA